MGKLNDMVTRVKDWKAGIPPEHRAEARLVRDELKELKSQRAGYAISHGTHYPPVMSTDMHGTQVYDHSANLMADAQAVMSLFSHPDDRIREEALALQAKITEKENRLSELETKK